MVSKFQVAAHDHLAGTLSIAELLASLREPLSDMQNSLCATNNNVIIRTIFCAAMTSYRMESVSGEVTEAKA